MNTKKNLCFLVASSLTALASHVQAAAYAVSYNNISNLSVTSTDAAGNNGPFFIPLSAFTDFNAISTTSAQFNGIGDPLNPANADSGGGPVDALVAFGLGSLWPVAPPANNAMAPVGRGGNYSRGDAQVGSTALLQAGIGQPVTPSGNLTQAWSIAESYVAADGSSRASGLNGSETGFNTTITLTAPAILYFSFDADPYMEVEQSATAAGGTVNSNLDVTFSVTSGGSSVFSWSPNGRLGSISGGTETRDDADLNGSIEVTVAGDSAVFDPTGDNSAGDINAGGASFAAQTNVLPQGTYTISLDMLDHTNIRTAESAALSIMKTPDADDEVSYRPGDDAFFTIKVTSEGPGTATGVTITDDLPTGGIGLTWTVFSENGVEADAGNACSITGQDLLCNVGTLAAGEMYSVTVVSTIPVAASTAAVAAAFSAIGTDFNATDGNLLLDNSEIPAGVGAPALDTNDWESFAGSIDCDTSAGCVRDVPAGNTDDSYTRGAKEDTRNPATSVGSIPPSKDDLDRWYFAQEFIGGKAFLYLAWVRLNQLGTATIDFELNQSGLLMPNGVNPVRTEGDVLIVYDFRGGRVDRLDMLRWLEPGAGHVDGDCEANSGSVADGCWGNMVDLLGSGLAEGAVNFDDNGTNRPTDDGFAAYDPIDLKTIEKARFGEAAIDFTAALGDPEDCVVFGQAFVKSRASSSFTSELKDYIAPVPVFISNCVPIDNTAIGDGSNVPQVSDDGSFLLIP